MGPFLIHLLWVYFAVWRAICVPRRGAFGCYCATKSVPRHMLILAVAKFLVDPISFTKKEDICVPRDTISDWGAPAFSAPRSMLILALVEAFVIFQNISRPPDESLASTCAYFHEKRGSVALSGARSSSVGLFFRLVIAYSVTSTGQMSLIICSAAARSASVSSTPSV